MDKKPKNAALQLSNQITIKDFLKRHNIPNDPNNPNISYFLKKIRKTPDLLQKEDNILTQFIQDLDQCKYFDLLQIENLKIFTIIPSLDKKKQIVLFFAYRFPSDKKLQEKTYLYFIESLAKHTENQPCIIYDFHQKAPKFSMSFLKNCYKRLPLKFMFNLEKVFIIHAGIMAKSTFLIQSGFHAKLLKKRIKYVKDINKLKKQEGFHTEALEYLPEELLKRTEESMMISHQLPMRHTEIIGVDFTDLSLSEAGIPEIIALLVNYFETDSKFIKTKGIFRNASSEKDIKRLEKALIEHDFDYIFEIENPHIVSSLLKRIFNKTLDPLFLYENYEEIIAIGKTNEKNIEEFSKKIINLLKKLPKLNLKVLSFIIAFIRKVITKKDDNMMDSFNMAMVFAPCFIRPKIYTPEDIAKTSYIIVCLKFIIENYKTLFEEKFEDDSEEECIVNNEEYGVGDQLIKVMVYKENEIQMNEETKENEGKNKSKSHYVKIMNTKCFQSDYEGKNTQRIYSEYLNKKFQKKNERKNEKKEEEEEKKMEVFDYHI